MGRARNQPAAVTAASSRRAHDLNTDAFANVLGADRGPNENDTWAARSPSEIGKRLLKDLQFKPALSEQEVMNWARLTAKYRHEPPGSRPLLEQLRPNLVSLMMRGFLDERRSRYLRMDALFNNGQSSGAVNMNENSRRDLTVAKQQLDALLELPAGSDPEPALTELQTTLRTHCQDGITSQIAPRIRDDDLARFLRTTDYLNKYEPSDEERLTRVSLTGNEIGDALQYLKEAPREARLVAVETTVRALESLPADISQDGLGWHVHPAVYRALSEQVKAGVRTSE